MKQSALATYVTWQALYGKASTIEELRDRLVSLPRLQVVQACAVINIVLKTWQGAIDTNEHEKLLRLFFSRSLADQLNEISRRPHAQTFVFHRQQLLFLMREAIANCPDLPDMGEEFGARLAECCLRANDLLDYGLAMNPSISQVERLLPELMTMNDFTDRQSILRRTARTRILLEEVLDRPDIRRRAEFIDVPAIFSAATGLTIREYSNLLFGILTKYLNLTLTQYEQERNALILSTQYFRNTQMEVEKIATFLKDVSGTFSDLQLASKRASYRNDVTALRDRPLVQVGRDSYFPLDIGFIADKLETGVFWRVHSACSSNVQKEKLHAFWGHLFHHYVTDLLCSNCPGESGRFIAQLTFADGKEVTDGAIVSGSNTVLMEYKASMLTADAKYSGVPDQLMKNVDLKFVGTPEKPKGIRQLAHSIARCWNKKKPEMPQVLASTKRVFPVLVARDSALGSPLVNRYLNDRFLRLNNRKTIRPVVTPLFVLTIDELESIAPHLSCVALHEVLEAKYKSDPKLDWHFSVGANEVLDREPERKSKELEAKFERVINQACLDFFGRSSMEPQNEEPIIKESERAAET